jgi:hypothetical protein
MQIHKVADAERGRMTTLSAWTRTEFSATALSVTVASCMVSAAQAETLPAATELSDFIATTIARSYQKSPAAVVVATAGLSLPLLGIVMMALRRASRMWRRWNAVLSIAPAPPVSAGPAWLEIEGAERRRLPLRAELSRIGRDADNDLTFTGPGIAATHALIQRTPERRYLVVDVSGDPEGSLTVNGARCRHATLVDGDRIAFGRAAMTFRHSGIATNGTPTRHTSH